MTPSPSADNQPKDQTDAAPVAPVAPDFAATVQAFWEKNRPAILGLCAVVLLAIVGSELWQYVSAQREKGIQEEYQKVSDSPARLPAFAEANAGHPLAGAALLRVADDSYKKGDFKAAAATYQKAAASIAQDALKARAKLGAAMSQIASGDKAAGEASLKAIAAEASSPTTVRAEATYHLASLALEAGRVDEVKKLVEEVTKLDTVGSWAQRAFVLRAQLPEDKAAAPAAGVQFKPGGE